MKPVVVSSLFWRRHDWDTGTCVSYSTQQFRKRSEPPKRPRKFGLSWWAASWGGIKSRDPLLDSWRGLCLQSPALHSGLTGPPGEPRAGCLATALSPKPAERGSFCDILPVVCQPNHGVYPGSVPSQHVRHSGSLYLVFLSDSEMNSVHRDQPRLRPTGWT